MGNEDQQRNAKTGDRSLKPSILSSVGARRYQSRDRHEVAMTSATNSPLVDSPLSAFSGRVKGEYWRRRPRQQDKRQERSAREVSLQVSHSERGIRTCQASGWPCGSGCRGCTIGVPTPGIIQRPLRGRNLAGSCHHQRRHRSGTGRMIILSISTNWAAPGSTHNRD